MEEKGKNIMDNYSLSVGVIVIKGTDVLLVKHNYGSAKGKYLNPGGHINDSEMPDEAAVREVYEETGVKVAPRGMIGIRCQSGGWYMVLRADYIEGEPCPDMTENDDAVFMNISAALSDPRVTDTAKMLIKAALNNKIMPAVDCRKNRVFYSVDNII